MNIDEYFLRRQDRMPSKDSRKSSKTSRPEATASLPDFSPVVEEQQPLMANTEDALDLAFRQTFQEIMANITRVIDEKLGLLSQTGPRPAAEKN